MKTPTPIPDRCVMWDFRGLRGFRGGFTLIEMLVVISIISLLVAVLLPALAASRRASVNLKCLAQTKQHGLAMASHATDSKDFIGLDFKFRAEPPPNSTDQKFQFWHYLYDPYLNAKSVVTQAHSRSWICPQQADAIVNPDPPYSRATTTYAGNQYVWGTGESLSKIGGLYMYDAMSYRLSDVRKPSTKLFSVEKITGSSMSKTRSTGSQNGAIYFGHPGKVNNVSFLDGHSAPVKQEDDSMAGEAGTTFAISTAKAIAHHRLWNPGYNQ